MQANELFRYVSLRAPRPRRGRIDLGFTAQPTLFMRTLQNDLVAGDARQRVIASVGQFLGSPAFPRDVRADPLLNRLHALHAHVLSERPANAAEAIDLVRSELGSAPAQFIAAAESLAARDRVRDAIIALKLAANPPRGALAPLTRVYQVIAFIERLATRSQDIDFSRPSRMLSLPLRLPVELATLQSPRQPAATSTETLPLADDVAAAQRIGRLDQAIVDLTSGATDVTRRTSSAASGRSAIVLSASALARLASATRATLSAEGIDADAVDLREALDTLDTARSSTLNALTVREAAGDNSAQMVLATLILPDTAHTPMLPADANFLDPSTRPPTTVGPLEPTSVGNLLITRQQIKRYEAAEISHIENVMQSASLTRSTRRLTRTEESFQTEQENVEEEERDRQTTDRLELQSTIEKTISEARAFEVGGSISAGYGPFVQVEAHANYESESSTEEAESRASAFAREMSERAAKKVSQRIRTLQTRTTLEEFEETNTHGFDNTQGTGHVSGIFQWVDRIYELQVYDAGVRIIFEFVIPEPAALYLRALDFHADKSERPRRPSPLTIRPRDITINNYDRLAARYQAEGITPPPPYRVTIGHAFAHSSPDGTPTVHAAFETVKVQPDYRAVYVAAEIRINDIGGNVLPPGFGGNEGDALQPPAYNRVDLLVGHRHLFRRQNPDGFSADLEDLLDNLDGDIAVAICAENIVAFAATLSIECIRRPDAYEAWQLKTHEALTAAYKARLAEYKNDLATLAAQQASQPSGRNPTQNRIIEQNEIKRLSIMMLSGQRFHSTSVPLSPQAAEFDFERALAVGNYAKFWESVMDWRNLNYVFHPYYWANQSTWGRMLTEDSDPLHAQFLAAGAATVRLAVTPGFETALLHFLETGNIWTGGELPEVTREDYLAYLDEIDARRPEPPDPNQPLGGIAPDEVAVGQPWELRLPTTLVAVRHDSALPQWVKNDEGQWLPIELMSADA